MTGGRHPSVLTVFACADCPLETRDRVLAANHEDVTGHRVALEVDV